MIMSVEEFKTFVETDMAEPLIEAKLQSLELLIRKYTNNNFQNRLYRRTADIIGGSFYVTAVPFKAGDTIAPLELPEKKKYVKVLVDDLAVRKTPSWDSSAVSGRVAKNEVFTIAEGPIKVGGGSMYKLISGLYITAASKYVSVYEK